MKYINHEHLGIIVFGHHVTHFDMARELSGKISSAGFVGKDEQGNLYCHGRSESLNLDSNKEDTLILRSYNVSMY